MMNQGIYLRGHGEAGRWRTSLLGLAVLVVALIGALLVASPASSQDPDPPFVQEIGSLDLFGSDALGDGFDFIPTGTAAASLTEEFSTNNRSKLSEVGPDDLVTLIPNGQPGGTSQLWVGLKDHLTGVRARGEGNGTPASQVNGEQTLTIDLDGADLPGDGASSAEFGLKFKFGATVLIEAFDTNGGLVASGSKTCDGGGASDCGNDSGGDRDSVRVPAVGDVSTPFTTVVISISDPADGAVSLLDEPGVETSFTIVEEFDGEIACDVPELNASDEVSYVFTRIGELDEDCNTIKPYNEAIFLDPLAEIQFEPDSAVQSVYRGDLTFPAGTGPAFFDPLTYDIDLEGALEDMLPCDAYEVAAPRAGTSTDDAEELALRFPEMGELVPSLYPELPGDEASCVVSYSTTAGGPEDWVVRLDFDPRYR